MDLSIVIPLINERESLPELAARLHQVLGAMGVEYEVLLIDDGSTDGVGPESGSIGQTAASRASSWAATTARALP